MYFCIPLARTPCIIKHQPLHVSGPTGTSSGSTKLYKTVVLHFRFQQFCYMQETKMLNHCFIQLYCWAGNMWELRFCNIIVILIELCALVGLNCDICLIMHGMENVKIVCPSVTTAEQLNRMCLNLILEKKFNLA